MPDAYDPWFLATPVPMPGVPADVTIVMLPFTHFTVVLAPERRLAIATAVNLDGARLLEIDRGDDWQLDPRVPAEAQTGPEVYARNDLDRGHLVRRRDPVWGERAVAEQANLDTFSYVNAAPQAALFNQGELLWAGLEDYVLEHARTYAQRLTVLTAPVFGDDDPLYRGTRIPRRFWKIAAWNDGDEVSPALAATGYVLDQSEQLDRIDLTGEARASAPPLGAYLTYQVPVVDIATLTGLDLGPLVEADRLPVAVGVRPSDLNRDSSVVKTRWVQLQRVHDVIF
ncbi:DNA/RNA non-specific endonuclease [Microlunatus antarcticus]|uniref:Endonuclease G n=1 Tax=Microlunatus antarcticus TaxID=53388 RepID=A0A7W5P592_9ACTN|nr:endonuclease G [Microlunatus antarcticus]